MAGQDGAQGRDLFAQRGDGALEGLVVGVEELDLGLERLQPRLLALPALERRCDTSDERRARADGP